MDKKPNYENGEGQSFNISKGFGADEGTYKKPDKQNQETKSIIESMGDAFVKGVIPDIESARKILDSFIKSRQPNEDKK
jgi:hypothetical protein